ncbi:hypothetical protein SAMN06297164_2985 [Nitrosomonas ureae]|uniref:Uncharacterized protein n=1 Tax=Nitrosomonas ureae TaxID=44577 RepID=A0A286AG76_9PROT|nr:hypothetical protein SAMN06297164_2985 [Nitrosomonas ureae]
MSVSAFHFHLLFYACLEVYQSDHMVSRRGMKRVMEWILIVLTLILLEINIAINIPAVSVV